MTTLLDRPPLTRKVHADEAVAVLVGVTPRPVVHEGPEVIALDVRTFLHGQMHPLQVLRDEVDPVIVLDAAVRVAIAFLPLDPHPVLRDEALDVPVVLTKVRQNVIDALLVNLPATMTVHLPPGIS